MNQDGSISPVIDIIPLNERITSDEITSGQPRNEQNESDGTDLDPLSVQPPSALSHTTYGVYDSDDELCSATTAQPAYSAQPFNQAQPPVSQDSESTQITQIENINQTEFDDSSSNSTEELFTAYRILKKTKKIDKNHVTCYVTDDEDDEDKCYYIKWSHYPYNQSTNEDITIFSKSEAGKILVPLYPKEKEHSIVFGFYLIKYTNINRGNFYFPAYVKINEHVNKQHDEIFVYNYCYHEFEIIKDGKMEDFISSRDLNLNGFNEKKKYKGICVFNLLFDERNRYLQPECKNYSSEDYIIEFETKTQNSYAPVRVYLEHKKKNRYSSLQFCISELVLIHDFRALEEAESPCFQKLIDDHSTTRKSQYYNNMNQG